MNLSTHRNKKKILIAVNASENSRRAVSYVSKILGGFSGFHVVFLHVIDPPEEDYFSCRAEQEKWMAQHGIEIDRLLEGYRQIFIREGFDPKALSLRKTLRFHPSVAECILEEQARLECGTIVVGRQALSRSEEFLFGSISSKIVSHAKNCTVWVVE